MRACLGAPTSGLNRPWGHEGATRPAGAPCCIAIPSASSHTATQDTGDDLNRSLTVTCSLSRPLQTPSSAGMDFHNCWKSGHGDCAGYCNALQSILYSIVNTAALTTHCVYNSRVNCTGAKSTHAIHHAPDHTQTPSPNHGQYSPTPFPTVFLPQTADNSAQTPGKNARISQQLESVDGLP